MPYEVVTFSQRPDLADQINRLCEEAWPRFLLHANTPNWRRAILETFTEFQILLCESETLVAVGHTVPFVWKNTVDDLPCSFGEVLTRALESHHQRQTPTTLSALAVMVAKDHQRQGLSSAVLREMTSIASDNNLSDLIAPVRPTLKSLYPLTPMERYVRWKRADGLAFDPWMRVHEQLGAEQLQIVPQAMTVEGSVGEWEDWTGLSFPESGQYIVAGALQPVTIDREADVGHYADPNVWMRHPVSTR
jgi:GNAT superfamily N-acetyltransferase